MSGKYNVRELYNRGFESAEKAVEFDNAKEADKAMAFYQSAIEAFSTLAIVESSQKKSLLHSKIKEFKDRIDVLKQEQKIQDESKANPPPPPSSTQKLSNIAISNALRQANDLHEKAKNLDKSSHPGMHQKVISMYMEAADRYIETMKCIPPDKKGPLKTAVEKIISRITELKSAQDDNPQVRIKGPERTISPPKAASVIKRNESAQNAYATSELDVLRRSSIMNGHLFQPWLDIDTQENFHYPQGFTDPDGLLSLSPKQLKVFESWKRPHQFIQEGTPTMIEQISPYVITQDLVTDCSFVASLCITAAYEKRFRKQLITRVIYPQDHTGSPIYNPHGKYMVKLWFNGVPRKVIVDDLLPVTHAGKLLCSYTTNPRELWVSIIEKAYMKVNGGFDFPGSNSGIDLFALTGWIPESLSFEQEDGDQSAHERTWQRLMSAHKFGDCLITISTGELEEDEAKALGLVPTHAYAVLDVVEVLGLRMLQVKNPWRKKRWKGPYSAHDNRRWTPELQQALNFNPKIAQNSDDGLFWIDFLSVQRHFRGLFLNWNPELFSYRTTLHKHWSEKKGPKNDTYNVGYNPQYSLTVRVNKQAPLPKPSGSTRGSVMDSITPKKKNIQSVWVLLTRHVTDKFTTDAKEQDYLTLHVYKTKKGERVYYPADTFIRGTYSNNPHTLTCLDVEEGDHAFTLVASQYEKFRDIDYTISIFSTTPFRLSEAPKAPSRRIRIRDEWTKQTAGGSPRNSTFIRNPEWKLTIRKAGPASFFLEAPIHYAVNIRLFKGGYRVPCDGDIEEVGTSGDYRSGFCYFNLDNLDPGDYTVVPSTFNPDSIGSFSLTIATKHTALHESIPLEGHGMILNLFDSHWSSKTGTAAGCNNFGRYIHNPRFLVHIPNHLSQRCSLLIRLIARMSSDSSSPPSINVSIYQSDSAGGLQPNVTPSTSISNGTSNNGVYIPSIYGVVTPKIHCSPGYYAIIPSTFRPSECSFQLFVYSTETIIVKQLF